MLRYFLIDSYRMGSPSKLAPGHLREKKGFVCEREVLCLSSVCWVDNSES